MAGVYNALVRCDRVDKKDEGAADVVGVERTRVSDRHNRPVCCLD